MQTAQQHQQSTGQRRFESARIEDVRMRRAAPVGPGLTRDDDGGPAAGGSGCHDATETQQRLMNGVGIASRTALSRAHPSSPGQGGRRRTGGALAGENAVSPSRFRRFRLKIKHYACGLCIFVLAYDFRATFVARDAGNGAPPVMTPMVTMPVALGARRW